MNFGVASIKDLAELLSYLVVIIGIPVAIVQYVRAVRSEQKSREDATYDAVENKFIEFQRLCLEYPRLDVAIGVRSGSRSGSDHNKCLLLKKISAKKGLQTWQ